ncbi:hypothetical protein SPRG_00651 [Saprolegnia parasitica CBS 223.65]|uniref:Uncharacterized protein n=1 Tax=Saprolegnia parasitica (strain CBS 223.65) TaxID=695850 RepID=A0A067CVQ3_SAPPC|nr:hypothetical protein SPRG_00651 [Saprolegnia parasitica CBS 223.65]KDO34588.1 hypothetical protein SPRG_00651 [Saprolegnia parasitica CBS 223.65]|eukprot:XP_012194265.1 hypothetical protein SPRG_00651 [Saprolegnia parasitica CBS 223.65]
MGGRAKSSAAANNLNRGVQAVATAGASSSALVLNDIDRLLRVTAPVVTCRRKHAQLVENQAPPHKGHAFARAARTSSSPAPKTRPSPASYAPMLVAKRVPGLAWRPPPPPVLPDHLRPTFVPPCEHDSDSTDSNPPRPREAPKTIKPRKPAQRSVGYYSVSYALVEPRVRYAPLLEQAAKTRAAASRRRAYHRLVVQTYASLRRPSHALETTDRASQRLKGHATFSKARQRPVHRNGVPLERTTGRDVVVCRCKHGAQRIAFASRLQPKATLGPGAYDTSGPKGRRCAINYAKAKGRGDAKLDPFGRKLDTGVPAGVSGAERPSWDCRVPSTVDMARSSGRPPTSLHEDPTLALSPQYGFGKPAPRGHVPFAKLSRGNNQDEHRRETEELDLDVRYSSVEPRVKVLPFPTAATSPTACDVPTLELSPAYDAKWPKPLCLVSMATDRAERWPKPTKQHPEQCDLQATPLHVQSKHKKAVHAVNMDKQVSWPSIEPDEPLSYDDIDPSKLSTHARATTAVDMAKDGRPRIVARHAQDDRPLDLSPHAAVHSRVKRVPTGVNMATQKPRPATKQLRQAELASPSIKDGERRRAQSVAMATQTGRRSRGPEAEEVLQLSPRTNGLSEHRRVKGTPAMRKPTTMRERGG